MPAVRHGQVFLKSDDAFLDMNLTEYCGLTHLIVAGTVLWIFLDTILEGSERFFKMILA